MCARISRIRRSGTAQRRDQSGECPGLVRFQSEEECVRRRAPKIPISAIMAPSTPERTQHQHGQAALRRLARHELVQRCRVVKRDVRKDAKTAVSSAGSTSKHQTTTLRTHPDHFGRSMRTTSDSSLDRSKTSSRPSGEISKSPIVKPRPSAVSCRSRPVLRSRTQSSL
jgi:hypothetical protein